MNRKVLKIDDLSPDSIKITVNWEDMVVGSSAFIPCINTEKAHQQIKNVEKQKKWTVKMQVRVEDAKLGVRLWRTT
tara:strand:+ start:1554 stop:1781 length:228 start_codon:yes stop_codon:yes gene_type:complete